MIVYSANKRTFVHDVRMNVIASRILGLIREKGLNAGRDRPSPVGRGANEAIALWKY